MLARLGIILAALLLAAGLVARPGSDETRVILVAGDFSGYLSPCGCTKPMSGGIRRLATAVRSLGPAGRTTLLVNGPLVHGHARQDEVKAETLAEALKAMDAAAVHLTSRDIGLGDGVVGSIARLSGDRVIAADRPAIPPRLVSGPLLIGAAGGAAAESLARDLAREAQEADLLPALLLDGGRDQARRLAEAVPGLRLVVYRSGSRPPTEAERIGKTTLVTPGEKGKAILRLELKSRELARYRVVELGPEFEDDQRVSGIYRTYQSRVRDEKLLERVPRSKAEKYAGSSACMTCHSHAWDVWKASRHSRALKTLEDDGHDRDPDCTGCHVVGLADTTGFISRKETPDLADVGCESCHGPAADHVRDPYKFRLPMFGEKACMPCHVPEHSPGFDFRTYWEKIKH